MLEKLARLYLPAISGHLESAILCATGPQCSSTAILGACLYEGYGVSGVSLFAGLALKPAWLMAALTLVCLAAIRLLRNHIVFFWFAALPGIIVHEITHWVSAFVTFGHPGFPRFMPKRVPGGYIMARVPIHHPTWYNGAIIGLSPLWLLPLAYQIFHIGMPEAVSWSSLPWFLITPVLTAEMLLECLPSPADWRLARRSWLPILIAVGFCVWRFY